MKIRNSLWLEALSIGALLLKSHHVTFKVSLTSIQLPVASQL